MQTGLPDGKSRRFFAGADLITCATILKSLLPAGMVRSRQVLFLFQFFGPFFQAFRTTISLYINKPLPFEAFQYTSLDSPSTGFLAPFRILLDFSLHFNLLSFFPSELY